MNHDIFSVNGLVTVVTGASRGLGKVLASGFLTAGASVVGLARSLDRLAHIDEHEHSARLP